MNGFLDQLLDPALFATLLRVATPLLLAALGVMISDRAGVLNIGMEGMMLSGALTGVLVSAATGSPWMGFFGALLASASIGLLMAFVIHRLGTDLIMTGIAVNLAAASATTLGLYLATGDKGMSGALKSGVLPSIDMPVIGDIPVLGAYLSGHHVLTYLALLCVPVMSVLMSRTTFGLHVRASGVDPKSVTAAGISVRRVQTIALMISGLFGGAAGAYLSMGYVSWFAQNMTAGRGFIAVAAEVMGMGTAWGTLAASIVLATAETLAITMQSLGLPHELMQMIPYVVPVVVLTLHAGRRRRLKRQSLT
ncbi:ABC transporter permease [Rhizobium daejeonense]